MEYPAYISASRLKLADRCIRKFIGKYPSANAAPSEEESPALSYGRAFHDGAELLTNTPGATVSEECPLTTTEMREYLGTMLPFWKDADVYTEVPTCTLAKTIAVNRSRTFTGETALDLHVLGMPVVGYIDALVPGVGILDHKTMKNGYHAKTGDDLAQDLQMMLYANYYMLRYPEQNGLYLAHGQYYKSPRRKDPKHNLVQTYVTYGDVVAFRQEVIEPLVRRVIDAWDCGVTFSEAAPEGRENNACYDYGGCEFGPRGDKSCAIRKIMPAAWRKK